MGLVAPIPLAYLALFTPSQRITFLKVTCADGRPMLLCLAPPARPAAHGCVVHRVPGTPFSGAVSGLTQTRGGARGRAPGVCTPRGEMRWSVSACFGSTRAMGPMSPRLGAFRCGGLRLAVALTFRPRKGVPHPEGTVIETVPWPVGLLYPPVLGHGAAGWRGHGARCGVCSPA